MTGAEDPRSIPDDERPTSDDPRPAPDTAPKGRRQEAGSGSAADPAPEQSRRPRTAADLRDLARAAASRRLSLSARARGQGWDKPEPDLAKYRSGWRVLVRRLLQQGPFRAVVRSNITQTVIVHRRVRSVRGPFVLVANHTSHLDAPMLAQGLPFTQARFLSTGVAEDYFFRVWYRRWFVRWLFNAFPIDRGGSRKNSGVSRRLLRIGVPILVFPEGSRQKTGVMAEFKPGAAGLATAVGVPVIPAAIVGGHEAMPKGRNWPKKGRPPVAVVFGEPMTARDGESVADYTLRIRARVKGLYDEHYEQILGAPNPRAMGEEGTA